MIMYCPRCGTKANERAEFCTNCGLKFRKKSTVPPVVAKCICPSCGAKNNLNASECVQCAEPIDKAKLGFKCPNCNSIMRERYNTCPVCRLNYRTGRQGRSEDISILKRALPYYPNSGDSAKVFKIIIISIVIMVLIGVLAKIYIDNRTERYRYDSIYTAVYTIDE